MKTNRVKKPALAFISLFLLAGCGAMNTPYTQPEVAVPAAWSQPVTDTDVFPKAALSDWWTAFGDPALNELVAEALRVNNDLAIAAIRVRRAQLQAGLAEERRTPQLDGRGSLQLDRELRNDQRIGRSASLSTSASWELDLWNRLANEADAAAWEALATEQDRQAAAQALVGTVVDLYWQIAYLNERIALSEESVAYAQRTLTLVRSKFSAGAVSPLDVAEAQQSLESQKASQLSLMQQRVEQRNAMAILFDGPPNLTKPERAKLPTGKIPGVETGLPASLLGRRPDMRAAELRLRSQLASIDATRASYYPTFSLTGSLGSSSTTLVDVLRNPIAALGAGLSLPFLQWSQMEMEIDVSRTQYEEAVVDFRQTLYNALRDVENALSARSYYDQQETSRRRSLTAALQAEQIYATRYQSGSVSLQSWLDAQEKRRSAQITLAENRLNQFTAFTALCQALGGAPVLEEP